MVNEGKGRLFRRKDGKYLIYVPKSLAEDSMFPWKSEDFTRGKRGGSDGVAVKVAFKPGTKKKLLLVETWLEPEPETT